MKRLGITVANILSDNGPEYVARDFRDHLASLSIGHRRIPARSPNHNAVVERFQGTMLQECWRPAFHRRRFSSIRQLQSEANAWLLRYNTRRRNHGDYMNGRRPIDILDNHTTNKTS
ncbi:MAG: integrase core domain-containing protein [Acidimicrobiia bacterium]|nr:integrase core domain-containing protein [Acidimicrobiia bacterium]